MPLKKLHMIKPVLTTITILAISTTLHAQYFYNDVIGTRETNRQMKNYVTQKVRTVTATGYDERGSKSTDFTEVQEVKENGKALKISTIASFKKTVVYSKFDSEWRIVRMADTTGPVKNITIYSYDPEGRLSKLENITRDSAKDFQRSFNPPGLPD